MKLKNLFDEIHTTFESVASFLSRVDQCLASGEKFDTEQYSYINRVLVATQDRYSEAEQVALICQLHQRGAGLVGCLQTQIGGPAYLICNMGGRLSIIQTLLELEPGLASEKIHRSMRPLAYAIDKNADISLIKLLMSFAFEVEDLKGCQIDEIVLSYIEKYPEIFSDCWFNRHSLKSVKRALENMDPEEADNHIGWTMKDYIVDELNVSLVHHRDFVEIFSLFADLEFWNRQKCFDRLISKVFSSSAYYAQPLKSNTGSTQNHLNLLKILLQKNILKIEQISLKTIFTLSAYLDDSPGLLDFVLELLTFEKRKSVFEDIAIELGYEAAGVVPLALQRGASYACASTDSLFQSALQGVLKGPQQPIVLIRQVAQYHTGKVSDLPQIFSYHTRRMFSGACSEYLTQLEEIIHLLVKKADMPDSRLWLDCLAFNTREGAYQINHRLVKILNDYQVDINGYDTRGQTVFFYVARGEQIQALINEGADICQRNRDLKTIYYYHSRYGTDSVLIDYGVRYGVDVNSLDENGDSALHYALRQQRYEMAALLLAINADVGLCNHQEETAAQVMLHVLHQRLQSAGIDEKKTLIKIYQACGGDFHLHDNHDFSLMDYACQADDIAYARLLIKAGFDIEQKGMRNNLPAAFVKAIKKRFIEPSVSSDDSEYYSTLININAPLNKKNIEQAINFLNDIFIAQPELLFSDGINEYLGAHIQFALYTEGVFDCYLKQESFYQALLQYEELTGLLMVLIKNVKKLEQRQNKQVWGDEEVCFLLRVYHALAMSHSRYISDFSEYLTYVNDHSIIEGRVESIVEKHGYIAPVIQLLAITALAISSQHGLETFQSIAGEGFGSWVSAEPKNFNDFYLQLGLVSRQYNQRDSWAFEGVFSALSDNEQCVRNWFERAKVELDLTD